MVKIPTTGFCRLRFVIGTASPFMPVADIGLDNSIGAVIARDGEPKGEACAIVPWYYVARVEFATEAEKKAVEGADKAAADKKKKEGSPS